MLEITIPSRELWDPNLEEFLTYPEQKLKLEHSLVSIAKWEQKWHIPYFSDNNTQRKTREQVIDYVRCMTITQNVNPKIYYGLTNENLEAIAKYNEDKHTATWFRETPGKSRSREVYTAEVIYWLMFVNNIPMECQKWHINTLLTLIRVCTEKGNPQKMPMQDMVKERNQLNKLRKAKHHTRG